MLALSAMAAALGAAIMGAIVAALVVLVTVINVGAICVVAASYVRLAEGMWWTPSTGVPGMFRAVAHALGLLAWHALLILLMEGFPNEADPWTLFVMDDLYRHLFRPIPFIH